MDLDLHAYRPYLEIKKIAGNNYIWCPIRKKELVPQPEELVRQLLIQYLIHKKGFPQSRIQVEKAIEINGMMKRFDVLVYDHKVQPLLLIECKAHTESLNQKVIDQAALYNMALQCPYLVVCNGVHTLAYEIDIAKKQINQLEEFPSYEMLSQ